MNERTHVDLFSGIGGFALACRMVGGIRTIAFCECEAYCQAVLRKHWPDVTICSDIRQMKGADYGTVDILTGGWPCQPFSCAGKRRGKEDDRYLWPQMLRIVAESRPRWILGENVAGIVTMELDSVLSDLENLGYTAWPIVIPACAVDARHRRDRVWVMADSEGRGQERPAWWACENQRAWTGDSPERGKLQRGSFSKGEIVANPEGGLSGEQKTGHWRKSAGRTSEVVSDTHESGPQGHWQSQECSSERIVRPCSWPDEAEWFPESEVRRVAHGISNRVDRIKCLGNAIVPQVAAELIKAMIASEETPA